MKNHTVVHYYLKSDSVYSGFDKIVCECIAVFFYLMYISINVLISWNELTTMIQEHLYFNYLMINLILYQHINELILSPYMF